MIIFLDHLPPEADAIDRENWEAKILSSGKQSCAPRTLSIVVDIQYRKNRTRCHYEFSNLLRSTSTLVSISLFKRWSGPIRHFLANIHLAIYLRLCRSMWCELSEKRILAHPIDTNGQAALFMLGSVSNVEMVIKSPSRCTYVPHHWPLITWWTRVVKSVFWLLANVHESKLVLITRTAFLFTIYLFIKHVLWRWIGYTTATGW